MRVVIVMPQKTEGKTTCSKARCFAVSYIFLSHLGSTLEESSASLFSVLLELNDVKVKNESPRCVLYPQQ